ncbi:hypothetical protein [Tropicimonas marinistellae]|uniref:hypothetical protein n=1 Tax=Tropicimonas marinistellae TaxID=1739787 RepID=UPI001918D056|nr:hypothetical protein [Tropicimonas marinistellae]
MMTRKTASIRFSQAGVVVADGSSVMTEILADTASNQAGDVYSALSVDWTIHVGQVRETA